MPHFQAHECPPPSFSLLVGKSLFSDTLHFQAHQPTPPSSSPPASKSSRFQAHQPAPPSSSPPGSESSFVMCHVSKLTNPLFPLPPLQEVSPCLCHATFPSSLTCSSLFLPSSW